MSYISDYETELAALDEHAARVFNPDMYIVRLLLSSIDKRYASPLEIEKPRAQDTLPAVFAEAVVDFQNSDDDQEAADPDHKTAAARRESLNGAKSKTKPPVRKDDCHALDFISEMCDGPPKPKLLRRNTGPKWSIMKIIKGLDDLMQLAN